MKALIVAMLGLLAVEARSLRDAIVLEPDTCTAYDFEIDVFESFELLVDVSNYSCSAVNNLMFLSKAFHPGECIVGVEDQGCLVGPFKFPSESICNYWEDVKHFPFKGNVNATLMLIGGGETCMTKRHYSFGVRSDCDVNATLEFEVVTTALGEAKREHCAAAKSSVPLTLNLLILGGGMLLCILTVVIICVCCPWCPCSRKKNDIHREPMTTLSHLLGTSEKHFVEG